MRKLSIKHLVEFRAKTEKAKQNFATSLKLDEPDADEASGGDYWISALSAISRGYKLNDLDPIVEKKNELEDKYKETGHSITKTMYRRNINILAGYQNIDFRKWQPSRKMEFIKKHTGDSVLTVKGFQLKAKPNHIFSFKTNDIDEIGAIWFVTRLDGFQKNELGMFCELLHRYLKGHFSKNYRLNPKACIAVDVSKNIAVKYSQLENGEIPMILESTLDDIKKLM